MADTQPLAPTDAEIEALWHNSHPNRFAALSFARAVLSKWGVQPVPAGYALVPVVPTSEMVDAAHEAHMPFGDMALAIQLAIAAAPQPVAREPLTDEQIRELWRTRSLHALEFARAIESAHGISPAQEAN